MIDSVLLFTRLPTLVMHGEEDYAVDPYAAIQAAEAIANAELVLLPTMGHIPFNRELRNRFEQEIIRFVLAQSR